MKRKKIATIIMALAILVLASVPAMAGWEEDVRAAMKNAVTGGSAIMVTAEGDDVVVTLTNPQLSLKGDTSGKYMLAASIRIASGILDGAGKDPYVTPAMEVKGGKLIAKIINYAKAAGVPVVEHLHGIGISTDDKPGYLVLDPNDQWVVYETKTFGGVKTVIGDKANPETLAIGILMCPNGKIMPLKALGKGKLIQGKHPELAESCK